MSKSIGTRLLNNVKERLGKPSKKRRKLDEEEWCDALNNLSVDSSDDEDDVYYDAPVEPIDITEHISITETLPRTASKRKRRQKQEVKKSKKQNTMIPYPGYLPKTSSSGSKWRAGSYSRTSKQHQSVPSDSRTAGYDFENNSNTRTPTRPYRFGAGGSSSSTTSERDTTLSATAIYSRSANIEPRPPTIESRPQTIVSKSQSNITVMGHQDTDGLSDSQIEKLATALVDIDRENILRLGQELGLFRSYFGSGKMYKSVILAMLRDWKHRIPDAQQVTGLLQALKKSNLERLTANLYFQEGPVTFKGRKVTVTLMTSSELSTIEGLRKKLRALQISHPNLIGAVKVYQLPYSGLKHHTFKEDVDIMVLCHSIHNRRFSITNVTDSLYDEFLKYCHGELGKERIVVMAHDFPQEEEEVRAVKMISFRHSQYSTFDNAGLVMICGMMDDKRSPEIREQDWDSLVTLLEKASKNPLPSKYPPTAHTAQTSLPKTVNSNTKLTSKLEEQKVEPREEESSRFGGKRTRSHKPVIYICTSWGLHSINGLTEMVRNSIKQCYSSCEIKETELPYSGLDDFKFPSEASKRDAMILCHSVQNRGFSITDVHNSIYNVFLKCCNQLFGKEHVAVIVHDFDCNQEILKINLQSLERAQPTTYKFAGFVALARDLTTPDAKLCYDPKGLDLHSFVRKIR